jgi:hypothetical protein
MRNILFFFTIFICKIGFSQSAGPNSGSIFSNVSIPGSCKSWGNFKAGDSDDAYASYDSLTGADPCYSDYLKVTGFNFSVPGSVSIKGILVEVERSDRFQRTADYRVRIVKGGVIGNAERSTGAAYPAADTYETYGGCTDLWGETWTPADFNSSNFGVAIAAIRTANGSNEGIVDHIRITICYNFTILPVKLNFFTAKKNGSFVDLNWQTTEESNLNHYEVEKSLNGSSFSAIQNINSRNQSSNASYSASDIQPYKGVNYYRLKMIDNNGKATYSGIAAVQFSSGKNIVLYPNPWLKGADLNITNMNGDLVMIDFYSPGGQLLGTSASTGRTVSTSALLHVKGQVLYKLKNKEGYIIGAGTLQVY